jgi:hypothetical protein
MRGRYECKNETPGPGWGSVVEHPFSMHRPWVPSIPSAKITKTQNKSHRGKIKKKKIFFITGESVFTNARAIREKIGHFTYTKPGSWMVGTRDSFQVQRSNSQLGKELHFNCR